MSFRIVILFLFVVLFLSPERGVTQTRSKEQVKQQAETKLQTMTPTQVDAKIKELGMTREQAEGRAKEYNVDLNTFLSRQAAPAGPVSQEQAKSMQSETKPDLPTADQQLPETVKEATKKESEKPTEIQGKAMYIGPGGLPYFGYQIFSGVPAAFEPTAAGPVDPEYLIGPEDVIRVMVWGQVEFQNEIIVDREGRILIPTIGPVLVSGLTLEQTYQKLIKQLSRSYSGIVAQPPTVWLDVTIARLRPKRVFIMGELAKPGGYTVSSYATVFNSLYSIGGPTVNGSLRDIRVIRGNKTIARIDLYDYLSGAEKTNDIRVQNNDIIFIPVRGKTVTIKGEIVRPGIYELLPKENLKKLLEIAGGAKATAYIERVQVDRIVPFQKRNRGEKEREIVDLSFREMFKANKDYDLADGDALSIYSILDMRLNLVTLAGAVSRPGAYQLEKVPTLRDLIIEADSLLPEAYLTRADIIRTKPDLNLQAIKVNLASAMKGNPADNLVLEPLDQIKVYSIHEMAERRFVSISGHVRAPGLYAFADSLTLYDLVFKAGGLEDSLFRAQTFLERADLIRLNPDGLTKTTVPFNLKELLAKENNVDRPLLPEDTVIIYGIEVVEHRGKFVEIFGNVKKPGRFVLTNNLTITDVLLLSGGYTEDANILSAEISRVVPKGMGQDSLAYIRFPILPDLSDSIVRRDVRTESFRGGDFVLRHRDQIFIRPNPEFKIQRNIILTGELFYPGTYTIQKPNERLSEVIKRAGGVTRAAYLAGGTMYRSGTRVLQDFTAAVEKKDENYDVVLYRGDSIHIPFKPNTVFIVGEINNSGLLGFVNGDNLWDYIDRAGGLRDSAANILLTYPNGNTKKVGTGWFASNPEVLDGSSIYITKIPPSPPEGERVDIAGIIRDTFAILASAVTVMVLAKSL